jgi:hypothetical protein
MVRHYNFGVEIEAVAKPYGGAECFSNVDWYRQLAQKLRNRGISAVHDDNSRYSKHPEYYGGKWFVTRDGSLKRERPLGILGPSPQTFRILNIGMLIRDTVCMEVVSPKLDTTQHVSSILSDFWEAMHVHFNPQRDISCGGHVHVTPLSLNNKFSFRSLKKIAFATVVYEDFVAAVLPQARRENKYCQANSQSVDSGLRETLLWGKTPAALQRVAAEIKSRVNETELYFYMQGNRYVLWNFQNIFPNPKTGRCTGTVEFRGGNQFLSTKGTLAWVAFVLGFITLALQGVSSLPPLLLVRVVAHILTHMPSQDLLKEFTPSTYVSPSDPKFQKALEDWWKRLRRAARKSRMSRYLPEDYNKMRSR